MPDMLPMLPENQTHARVCSRQNLVVAELHVLVDCAFSSSSRATLVGQTGNQLALLR